MGFAICLTYHLPNISGLTLSVQALARHLAELGYPVRVVTGRVPLSAPERESIEGIEIVRSRPIGSVGKALLMPGYPLAVWKALDGVSVVDVVLPNLDAATVAIIAKLRRRKLIVSYICSMSRQRIVDKFMRAVASIPHLIAGLLADRIQVVSRDYANASTFCRLFKDKLVLAPLPVPLELLPGETQQKRLPRKATTDAPFRIGYVGRIARQKNLHLISEAIPHLIERLGQGKFVIEFVGPATEVIGEKTWREVLLDVKSSAGIITYLGIKTGYELAQYYKSLDLLILPSTDRLESFGLVQVEAMLRGVPVVASDLPGMRIPVASTGMGRLFEPGNSLALAEAIIHVLLYGPPEQRPPEVIQALFGKEVGCAPFLELLSTAQAEMVTTGADNRPTNQGRKT
jgi:glycosyltransferase involved in cell wall biosynthesis